MSKNRVVSKKHLKEIVARNPELLEKGLKLVDTDLEMFGGDSIDILTIDGKDRLMVIAVSDEPQSVGSNKGNNILKDAFHAWNWLTYFKEGLLEGTEKKTGTKPALVPPRIAVIAPSFTKGLIDLAVKAFRALVDLTVYTYSKEDFKVDDKPFTRISLKSDLPPASIPKSITDYHSEKMDDYFYRGGPEFVDVREGKGYESYLMKDYLEEVGEDFKGVLKKFTDDIVALKLDLRPILRKQALLYMDPFGNEVCNIAIHLGTGFSLLVGENLFYWGQKQEAEKKPEEKRALSEIKSRAKALREKTEKILLKGKL